MDRITVHTKKSDQFPGMYQGYINIEHDGKVVYSVDVDIHRKSVTDALHDAAFFSEDYPSALESL